MFSEKEIFEAMSEYMKNKEIEEELAREAVIKEEMLIMNNDELFYDSLPQEAYESYCVPVRRYRRGNSDEY